MGTASGECEGVRGAGSEGARKPLPATGHPVYAGAMLTVLIAAESDAEPVVATFRALMAATLDGFVSDVIVRGDRALDTICDPAGAVRVDDGALPAALAGARGDWVLALEAGAAPLDGWMAPVARHAERSRRPARFTVAERSLWRALTGRAGRPLRAGLLLPVDEARNAASGGAEGMARGRTTIRLDARLAPPAG